MGGFVGSKYEATSTLRRVEIAKLIRKDIADAQKSGELPANMKVSVKCSRGSGIEVDLVLPNVLNRVAYRWTGTFVDFRYNEYPARERLTAAAYVIQEKVEKLVNAYNFDHSRIEEDYFNTRFYERINFDYSAEMKALEVELKAEYEAEKQRKRCAGVVAATGWDE